MVIIWGERLYGKVDNVPGLFHVATKCGHLQFLPLIPMESVLIFSKDGDGYRGVPIPMSFKSIAMAWLRIALGALVVTCVGVGIAILADRRPQVVPGVISIVFGVAFAGFLVGTYFVSGMGRASYRRAVQLAEKAELSEEVMVLIEERFGRVSKEDAERTLAELRSAGQQISELEAEREMRPAGSA